MADLIDPIQTFVGPFVRIASRAWAWKRLGPTRGEVEIRGLEHPVTVHHDEAGVPHVHAENLHDLFFAQGWLHARDRLWQMELLRRTASGRLAEVLGNGPAPWKDLTVRMKDREMVDLDAFFRTIGLRRAAEASLEAHSDEGRAVIEAYAAGVSRYITDSETPHPVECSFLGYHPDPWDAADSLAVARLMAFRLNFAWRQILTIWNLRHRFAGAEEMLEALAPRAHPEDAPRQCHYEGGTDPDEATSFVNLLTNFMGWGAGEGSNAFCVDGEATETESGKPLLASDPHLDLQAPCLLYQNHLVGGDIRVIGASVPGTPGVVMGHNGRVAWGMTVAMIHDCDWVREEVDPDDPDRYRVPDGWDRMDRRTVSIDVDEETPREHVVRSTRHGPVVSDVIGGAERGEVLAFRWTGHEASNDVDALLAMNRADGVEEFMAGTEDWSVPAVSFVAADTEGHVGYTLAGRVWKRPEPEGLIEPLEGWEEPPTHEEIPFAELPRLLDPEDGLVVSANHDIVSGDYPHYLSRFWEPPHRARRIRSLLQQEGVRKRKRKPLTPDELAEFQQDRCSGMAPPLVEELFSYWPGGDPEAEDEEFADLSDPATGALHTVVNWADESSIVGQASCAPSVVGASIFHVFLETLRTRVFLPRMGEELYAAWVENWDQDLLPAQEILCDESSPWWDPLGRKETVRLALEETVAYLQETLGPTPEDWQWGLLSDATLRHSFHSLTTLGPLFDIGPVRNGGDPSTVNRGYYLPHDPFQIRGGSAYRQVIDLDDPAGNSRWILAGGASGNPASSHYKDQAALWEKGKYLPMRFDDEEVEALGKPLLLEPQEAMSGGH